jgi:hypothetical protein
MAKTNATNDGGTMSLTQDRQADAIDTGGSTRIASSPRFDVIAGVRAELLGLGFAEEPARRSLRRLAAVGLAGGASMGIVIGFLYGLIGFIDPLVNMLAIAAWGGVLGAVGGLFVMSIVWILRPEPFEPIGTLNAQGFELHAHDPRAALLARRLLQLPDTAA